MEFQDVLQNVARHVSLTPEEAQEFASSLTPRELQRKEVLLEEGKVCNTFNYVRTGALRAYYRDKDDHESVIMFAIQDWWITDMYAYANQQPALLYIDALEPSVILQLKKERFDQLLTEIPKLERFFRILMQKAYVREQLRMVQNLSMTAEERYHHFVKKYPLFAQRLPLKQIAAYLGITPEFLSTIRKKSPRDN
jgi:CRP-like cAMP-binding protein